MDGKSRPEEDMIPDELAIAGVGIDIVEVRRIRDAAERWGERFLNRVFTNGEIKYCLGERRGYGSLAGRFAVKEAVFKALGTGWAGGVTWKDIEVVRSPDGRPEANLSGAALRIACGARMLVSISHTRDHAVAIAVMQGALRSGGAGMA